MAEYIVQPANVGPGFLIVNGGDTIDWKATREEAEVRALELEAKFGKVARKAADDELFSSLGFDPDNLPFGRSKDA